MRTAVALLALLGLTACSTPDDAVTTPMSPCTDGMDAGADLDAAADTDGGAEADAGPEGVAKCEAFLRLFCDRVVQCETNPPSHTDCIARQRTAVDCGAVVCATSSYDRCVAEVEEQTCGVWNATNTLPASCRGALSLY